MPRNPFIVNLNIDYLFLFLLRIFIIIKINNLISLIYEYQILLGIILFISTSQTNINMIIIYPDNINIYC